MGVQGDGQPVPRMPYYLHYPDVRRFLLLLMPHHLQASVELSNNIPAAA